MALYVLVWRDLYKMSLNGRARGKKKDDTIMPEENSKHTCTYIRNPGFANEDKLDNIHWAAIN